MVLYGIGIIDIPLIVLICPGDKRKKGIVFDNASCDFYAILHMAISKRIDVITCGRDADHQLICIGLHGLFESVVLRRLFICCYLVSNCKVAVKRVLRVRIGCHDLDFDGPIRTPVRCFKLIFDRVLKRVVFYDKVTYELFILECKNQKIKGFKRLLKCSGHHVDRGSGSALDDRNRKGKGCHEACFPIFSRDEYQRLFKSSLIGALVKKSEEVVNDEDLPRLQFKGLAEQWSPVQSFPFSMYEDAFHDRHGGIRFFCPELKLWALKVLEESFACVYYVRTGYFDSRDHVLRVFNCNFLVVFSFHIRFPAPPALPRGLRCYPC